MEEHPTKSSPPRWAENLLRFLLRDRDRDTVTGDLLEEYQSVVLPARGRFRANVWYVRQTFSFVSSVTLGLVIGAVFGVWNLLYSLLAPLADDTILALLAFYGPMFTMWGFAGFAACRRRGRFVDALKAGVIVGAMTHLVFYSIILLRVNLFLDTLSGRPDWQNLVRTFQSSGFESFRAHVNYSYAQQFIPKLVVSIIISTVTAALGGLAGKSSRGLCHALRSPEDW